MTSLPRIPGVSTRPRARCRSAGRAQRVKGTRNRGFTIIELIVCLGIITVLCGILLPSLRATREQAQRFSCQNNMTHIGQAINAYGMSSDGDVPASVHLSPSAFRPAELMGARVQTGAAVGGESGWDGLGILVQRGYIGPSECRCLHCASHSGEHPYERYADAYSSAARIGIYTNYHYSGHETYADTGAPRRIRIDDGADVVLLTDGLRTRSDFNHGSGLNRMRADLSVEWWADTRGSLLLSLPELPETASSQQHKTIWSRVCDQSFN